MTEWPSFTTEQVEFLLANFPPRCKEPRESLEAHMEYAGMVKLARIIADRRTIERVTADDELEDEVDRAIEEAKSNVLR